MFNLGDKVVLNGFKAGGEAFKYASYPKKVKWGEELTVLDVVSAETYNGECIIVVSDRDERHRFDPSELRFATKEEIRVFNDKNYQYFDYDFDNNFYILELDDSSIFIATHDDDGGDLIGLNREDKSDTSYLSRKRVKKIISTISKY